MVLVTLYASDEQDRRPWALLVRAILAEVLSES
jgi:hypothetical protein